MNGAAPRTLLLLGVPDAMTGTAAARAGELSLPGNTGLVAALLEALRAHGWEPRLQLLRPGGAIDAAAADVLVNAVCEPSIHHRSLTRLAQLQLRSGLPTLNPWWVIAGSGRQAVARRLAFQDGVQVPLCTTFVAGESPLAGHIGQRGHRYPVLLRPPGGHGSEGLVRADDAAAAQAAALAAGSVTDFVDFRSADGLYRKQRFVYAADRLFRRHLLVDRQWNLTAQSRHFMIDHPRHIEEEKEWLAHPVETAPGSVEARVLHQFRALQLDFGSADLAVLPDGTVALFEINACVQLTGSIPPKARHDWTYLEANNGEILDALLGLLRRRARSPHPAG